MKREIYLDIYKSRITGVLSSSHEAAQTLIVSTQVEECVSLNIFTQIKVGHSRIWAATECTCEYTLLINYFILWWETRVGQWAVWIWASPSISFIFTRFSSRIRSFFFLLLCHTYGPSPKVPKIILLILQTHTCQHTRRLKIKAIWRDGSLPIKRVNWIHCECGKLWMHS